MMVFDISRVYFNTFIVDLGRFTINPFLTLTINGAGYVCYGVGYDNDAIKLQLNMSQQFMDCAKTILKDLCDFSSVWTGYNAKFLDDCGASSNAEIVMYSNTFYVKHQNTVLAGTANPRSAANCSPWFVVSTTTVTTTTTTKAEVQNLIAMYG